MSLLVCIHMCNDIWKGNRLWKLSIIILTFPQWGRADLYPFFSSPPHWQVVAIGMCPFDSPLHPFSVTWPLVKPVRFSWPLVWLSLFLGVPGRSLPLMPNCSLVMDRPSGFGVKLVHSPVAGSKYSMLFRKFLPAITDYIQLCTHKDMALKLHVHNRTYQKLKTRKNTSWFWSTILSK